MLVAHPTPREQVGAALEAARQPQASYQPPRLQARPLFLGACSPGWIVDMLPGGWAIIAYRPTGLMTDAESTAVQRETLGQYEREIFTEAAGWRCMWSRRKEGAPALLVQRPEWTARDE
ncbi:MAG TPA: hypothetical protein VF276_10125 [Chloroflexia bacterium]